MDAQRVALITGAGSGIGRAAAVLFAGAGYAVALAGRREGPLRETAGLLGSARNLVIAADVADAAQAAGMVDRAAAGLGRLDVLVNNAGYAPNVPIEAHTAELLREVYAVNALGPAVAIARAWPVFSRQRSGCIINVSTLGTLDPFPGFFGYAAAKAAANVMVKSCATEGRAIGVRAFAVAPGAVETSMLRSFVPESVLPADATLRPGDVAGVILACAQGERDADNGRVIVVEKGGIRLAP
jgi:NAD(P)-dependent dehydrogenase (short-subunit alcohol dehydrogenase family)